MYQTSYAPLGNYVSSKLSYKNFRTSTLVRQYWCRNLYQLSVVNYFLKELRFLTGLWIRLWVALFSSRTCDLVITFSSLSFEWFFLHIVWYLFELICLWFHFQSHSQVQSLFLIPCQSTARFTKWCLHYYGAVKLLPRDKIVVELSQLVLYRTITCKWIYFWENLHAQVY